jgi:23S rRNA-/tRNA-specific pseudouridylate synthase/adenine/guanine phosphoribosyltransferase-like PRPP-binding protein
MPKAAKVVMTDEQLSRTVTRIAHEILEKNTGDEKLAVVGIHTRGAFLARRLHAILREIAAREVPLGELDISFYRDDVAARGAYGVVPATPNPVVQSTDLPFEVDGATVVLVDDVLYTGRTIRAAIDALFDYGRPGRVQLAALVDRGHRELPIRPDYIGKNLPTAQRERIEVHLTEVDGVVRAKHYEVRPGERVEVEESPPGEPALVAEDVPFTVVYQDDWLLVVDKPAGVVVHPAPGHEHGTLVHGLLQRGIAGGHELRPGIVHRLDRDTSGLLIVARRPDAYRRLVTLLAARRIARTYLALLKGDLRQDEGTIDAPIGRHLRDRTRMSLHSAAPRRAVTHFTVRQRLGRASPSAALTHRIPGTPVDGAARAGDAAPTRSRGTGERFTYVEVRLETGRTHQIRVHFAALGYPVAGDTVYGRGPRPAGLARQFLHAWRLRFPHPDDGRELEFEAPLPEDLASFLALLEGS